MSNSHPRQARWHEPIIYELGSAGQRGIAVQAGAQSVLEAIPSALRRDHPPSLPQVAQPQIVRHFLRLSQETLGVDLNVDVGLGTCTMKYNPKLNDRLCSSQRVRALHPLQPDETVQGALRVIVEFSEMLQALSGLHQFSFQPGGGTQAMFGNARIIRAYHASREDASNRDEVITTIFSHPGNAAAARTAGFKVVSLYPDEDGLPNLRALKAAVSERTAGFMVTNPEDTGIFNPRIDRFVDTVHGAGGLCAYDQANANGLLGITSAASAGFDLCQFNLHKTFGAPHGAAGLATGAMGASEPLTPFLPSPLAIRTEEGFKLDLDRPLSIGTIRGFHGVFPTILRAYAWVLTLGSEGLRTVAETAVLNNNYLSERLKSIPGLSIPYSNDVRRLEQTRYSWEELFSETGVTSQDISRRIADFGASSFFTSHHPQLVPEPMTIEPTESVHKTELDRYVELLRQIAEEAYSDPQHVANAPHVSTVHQIDQQHLDDPATWAATWRAHIRKNGDRGAGVQPRC